MMPSAPNLLGTYPAALLSVWSTAFVALLVVVVCGEAVLLAALLFERRRRHPTELQQQKAKEEICEVSRNAEMRQFVSTLAHDLAQPLAALLTNAQVAAHLAAAALPDLHEIQGALSDLIDDHHQVREVLQRARSMCRTPVIALHPIDLSPIAEKIVGIIRERADQHGVRLRLALSVEPFLVQGDEDPLSVVLWSLLNNAIDASLCVPADQRVVTVITEVDQAARQGFLVVEDHGSGIPEQIRAQLFRPFVSTKPKGRGMGLALSRSILDDLGGSISGQNRPVQGAAFRIALPLAN